MCCQSKYACLHVTAVEPYNVIHVFAYEFQYIYLVKRSKKWRLLEYAITSVSKQVFYNFRLNTYTHIQMYE